MKFLKLQQDGTDVLVNMSTVTEIYRGDDGKSILYITSAINEEQVRVVVDESLDEIYAKVKGSGE